MLREEQKFNLMWRGRFSQLKACNVSIAASGVFFTSEYQFVGSKGIRIGPGRPKYMCKTIFVYFVWSFEGEIFVPPLPSAQTLPLPPLLVCPETTAVYTHPLQNVQTQFGLPGSSLDLP